MELLLDGSLAALRVTREVHILPQLLFHNKSNRLWVQFSNSCFGFSIQKQIWEECGNNLEDDKDWGECCDSLGKFGKVIGWGEHQSWFSTREEELKLMPEVALRSPLGYMPISTLYLIYPLYRDEADQVCYFLNYLFSRVETCKL